MIIDCHTHLNQYTPDGLPKLLTAAADDGVGVFIDESVSAENAREVVAVANEREGIYCGVATMPWFIDTWADTDLETFAELIQTNDKIVCVGECGLDYSQDPDEPTIQKQQSIFREMINLAKSPELPLNMHTDVRSFKDLLRILREERAYKVGGMIHNYEMDVGDAHNLLDMGIYVSVGVQILHPFYPEIPADKLPSALREISIGQMVLESDVHHPLFPIFQDVLGDTWEAHAPRMVANKLAQVKGMPVEEVEAITANNARRLFGPRVFSPSS